VVNQTLTLLDYSCQGALGGGRPCNSAFWSTR